MVGGTTAWTPSIRLMLMEVASWRGDFGVILLPRWCGVITEEKVPDDAIVDSVWPWEDR
jgi:hypothetical protein